MSNFDHFLSSIEAEKCVAYFHIIFQIKRKTIDMTELFQNQIEKLLKINTPITHIYMMPIFWTWYRHFNKR